MVFPRTLLSQFTTFLWHCGQMSSDTPLTIHCWCPFHTILKLAGRKIFFDWTQMYFYISEQRLERSLGWTLLLIRSVQYLTFDRPLMGKRLSPLCDYSLTLTSALGTFIKQLRKAPIILVVSYPTVRPSLRLSIYLHQTVQLPHD